MAVETWNASGVPRPSHGFSPGSVFLNLFHLVVNNTRRRQDADCIKAFPWILWHLWKARNALVFEGTRYESASILSRAKEDADIWFSVNQPVTAPPSVELRQVSLSVDWKRPPHGMVKCNIGSSWSATTYLGGEA